MYVCMCAFRSQTYNSSPRENPYPPHLMPINEINQDLREWKEIFLTTWQPS